MEDGQDKPLQDSSIGHCRFPAGHQSLYQRGHFTYVTIQRRQRNPIHQLAGDQKIHPNLNRGAITLLRKD